MSESGSRKKRGNRKNALVEESLEKVLDGQWHDH